MSFPLTSGPVIDKKGNGRTVRRLGDILGAQSAGAEHKIQGDGRSAFPCLESDGRYHRIHIPATIVAEVDNNTCGMLRGTFSNL